MFAYMKKYRKPSRKSVSDAPGEIEGFLERSITSYLRSILRTAGYSLDNFDIPKLLCFCI